MAHPPRPAHDGLERGPERMMAAMAMDENDLIIEGVREDGGSFRPSDWIERLSTVVATFGPDHRLRYADGVQPRMINGRKCLVVKQSLRHDNPMVYEFVVQFARNNHLRMHEEPHNH